MDRFQAPPRLAVALIAMVALAACATPGTPAESTNFTGSTTPSATQSPASQASAAPSAPTKLNPSVDLTLTVPLSVVAKGTAGQCDLGKDGAGNVVSFRFGPTGADYPGLGDGFYVSEDNTGYLTINGWRAPAPTSSASPTLLGPSSG